MRHGQKAFLLLIATAVLIGCGGGGDDGGVIDDDSTTVSADFVADEPAPPASSVALEKGPASSNLVTVRVDVTGVSDVYGAAFELAYDATLADYVGFTTGTFLEQVGHIASYQVSSPFEFQVVVGVTRNGSVPWV